MPSGLANFLIRQGRGRGTLWFLMGRLSRGMGEWLIDTQSSHHGDIWGLRWKGARVEDSCYGVGMEWLLR